MEVISKEKASKLSKVHDAFDCADKMLEKFVEQDECRGYIMLCMENCEDNGKSQILSHLSIDGDAHALIGGILNGMKANEHLRCAVLTAVAAFADEVEEIRKDGKDCDNEKDN